MLYFIDMEIKKFIVVKLGKNWYQYCCYLYLGKYIKLVWDSIIIGNSKHYVQEIMYHKMMNMQWKLKIKNEKYNFRS